MGFKLFVIILIGLLGNVVNAKDKVVAVNYYKNIFGNIHKNPSNYSSILTTLACGHPVKILEAAVVTSSKWKKVKVGPHVGYIIRNYLDDKKPTCFQDRYPYFFDGIGVSITELYYWGKLYDQYSTGRSKVK